MLKDAFQSWLSGLLGPDWSEHLVAKELKKKGWEVFRQFKVYDPKQNQYAEIDVLGVSHDGFVIAEVKSYSGNWESRDYWPRPKWKKTTWWKVQKSPVWQVRRARLALVNSLLRDYPQINTKVIKACKTYVFLDRGNIINAHEPSVIRAWSQMRVDVLPIKDRFSLPIASAPAHPLFIQALLKYQHHFRWRWYFRGLKKFGRLLTHIEWLDTKWQTLNQKR